MKFKVQMRSQEPKEIILLADKELFERHKASGCPLAKSSEVFAPSDMNISLDLIKSIAVEMWRLEKRLVNSKAAICEKTEVNGEPIFDQLQRIKDVLFKYDIVCGEERVGESYNDGMSSRPLHFEDDATLPKGSIKIVEIVKPSVYFKKNLISHGEVIVAKSKEK